MESVIIKRSVVIDGHKTSISLENEFFNAIRDIAKERGQRIGELLTNIDAERHHANLSSAIRLFVLDYYRTRVVNRRALEQFTFGFPKAASGNGADAQARDGQNPITSPDFGY